MCGRYVSPKQAAIERFWHIGRHNWLQRFLEVFNVAPTSTVPVIIRGDDGLLELHGARWGLVPHLVEERRAACHDLQRALRRSRAEAHLAPEPQDPALPHAGEGLV
jgi:putative SOS response-associated peptidase YedK